MNLIFIEHPYWVLIILRVALVYCGEDDESLANISFNNNNNNSDNKNNSVPISSRRASITSPYTENILRKFSSTTPTPSEDGRTSSTVVVKAFSNADSVGQTETRSGRIMVSTALNTNRSSDTTDFARNTVPIKEQTPTDPTVKKTEPQRKIIRKPSPDLKNKIKGVDRVRYGGGPPGPDASMLAYNAFTSPVEATTEKNRIKKPFTTKSRPPPLSYLTSSSTIDSPLPPTAWALTTLKGSAPVIEHVKNTIPATASEQFKPSRPRTSLSSLKPINSFWSTRLSSKSPPTATVSSYETSGSTELPPIEEKTSAISFGTTSSTTTEAASMVIDSKSDDTQLNKIADEKTPSTSELNAVDTVNNTIIIGNSVSKDDEPVKEVVRTLIQKQAPAALVSEQNETQIKINKNVEEEFVVTERKPESQKATSNEIELQKDDILTQKSNNKTSIKLEPIEESINEAIKTADEENKLSKKNLDKNFIKKPINYENKNIVDITNKNIDNITTTENNILLTEKPFRVEETVKEVTTDNVNKSAVSENTVLLTEKPFRVEETVKEVTTDNLNKSAVSENTVLLTEKPFRVEETVKEVTTDNVNKSAVSENTVLLTEKPFRVEETVKEVTTDNVNKSAVSENTVMLTEKPFSVEETMKEVTTDNVNKSAVRENTVMLTEKPFSVEETMKEVTTDNVNKSAVSENAVISKALVTELDKFVSNVEHENNYNTAIYPFRNIINATRFTHKYLVDDKQDLNTAMDLRIMPNNDSELNAIKSSSSIDSYNNRTQSNIIKEIDQSTTSMTRATNATQAPVNSSTEASIVTFSSTNADEHRATTVAPLTTTTTTLKDELLTTVFVDTSDSTDLSEEYTVLPTTTVVVPEMAERMDVIQAFNMSAENLNITNENETVKNLGDTDNKVINANKTSYDNFLKRKNFTKTFTDTPVIATTTASNLMKNDSLSEIVKPNFELNQTNNDIKLGGDLDLPVPTVVSISAVSSTRTNYLKTTTEKQLQTTTKYFEITDEITVTEGYTDKEKFTTVNDDESMKQNETVTYESESTLSPAILHETDDVSDDDSLLMYNTTGNETKFAIDGKINITDLDDDGDESISAEKDLTDLSIPVINNTSIVKDETTTMITADLMKTTTEVVPRTNSEAPVSTTTTQRITTVSIITTTASLDEDVVTPGDDDSTGIEMEDYETGVIMPMNVRMFVHATYKEMCSSKDILIDSIVRFFQTIADRPIDRNQIKIKNLVHECRTPHPDDKGVVPVHLMITDNNGQYDKRLTDVFVLLVRQESLSFKYPITQVDKIIDHGMSMESETQGRGTIIAAIVISSIAGLCLLVLTILLVIMRKRQRGFNYGQRCTPVSLDDYSLDNISVYNSVRRKAMRASKRSYGNPAFDDPTAISNSLNFAGLAIAVNEKNKLEDEYSRIPVVTVKPDELPAGAEVKNRYANVIPLPETRVTLNTPNNNDFDQFINANFVKGTKGIEKFYIACQAPMKDTISDFWQMVWEQQSRIIIMLTDLHENGVEKCADYLPPSEVLDCHRVFGDLQVTLKKREAREKYIISSLQLKNLESNLWREVTHMWYVGWPVRGVPDDLSSIIAFLIEARSYAKNGPPPPIVVHCSPGTGRTGTIIAIDIAIRDFETNRVVDIPRTVYNVRRDRAGAVQTSQQYMFIYQVLHLYATKLTGGGLDSI